MQEHILINCWKMHLKSPGGSLHRGCCKSHWCAQEREVQDTQPCKQALLKEWFYRSHKRTANIGGSYQTILKWSRKYNGKGDLLRILLLPTSRVLQDPQSLTRSQAWNYSFLKVNCHTSADHAGSWPPHPCIYSQRCKSLFLCLVVIQTAGYSVWRHVKNKIAILF